MLLISAKSRIFRVGYSVGELTGFIVSSDVIFCCMSLIF